MVCPESLSLKINIETYLIHFFCGPHLDAQIFSDQREEGGGEVDHALVVDRLVHPDQLLESQTVGTLRAEAQRRIHVLQHVVHLSVVDPAPVKRFK